MNGKQCRPRSDDTASDLGLQCLLRSLPILRVNAVKHLRYALFWFVSFLTDFRICDNNISDKILHCEERILMPYAGRKVPLKANTSFVARLQNQRILIRISTKSDGLEPTTPTCRPMWASVVRT